VVTSKVGWTATSTKPARTICDRSFRPELGFATARGAAAVRMSLTPESSAS
jgi:hypothetical protein